MSWFAGIIEGEVDEQRQSWQGCSICAFDGYWVAHNCVMRCVCTAVAVLSSTPTELQRNLHGVLSAIYENSIPVSNGLQSVSFVT